MDCGLLKSQYATALNRWEELEVTISQPEIIADQERYTALLKERSQLEPLVRAWHEYQQLMQEIADADALTDHADYAELAQEELRTLQAKRAALEEQLQILLLPKDPDDEKDAMLEIRSGAGGDEASLFGAVLMRMYLRYAERHGYRMESISMNETEIGGVKEAIFSLSGKGAYSRLKYESGVHRVQRVPVTETSGRIHTSTCTVAVLPAAEEVEVHIDPEDLRIDVYRSSGHGGQYVNTTDSAVRITHLPTGIVVTCQDEKHQIENKAKAMKVLRARLLQRMRQDKDSQYAAMRRGLVGTGDRSERVRSYNFPQGRVTDHRIGLTLYRIDEIIDGDLDEFLDTLQAADLRQQLAARS